MSLKIFGIGPADTVAVSGKIQTFAVDLKTGSGAYTAGWAIGDAFKLEFGRVKGAGCEIRTVSLIEETQQDIAATLWVFRKAFTRTADSATLAPSADDMKHCAGFVAITTIPTNLPTNGTVMTVRGVGLAVQCYPDETALYCQLQTNGTPTYNKDGVRLVITAVLE